MIVKSVLILKMQDVFENTRCLDFSNATVLSLFRHVVWYKTATLSSNCLRRRPTRPLTSIYGKSKQMRALFDRLSPYLTFVVVTCQHRAVPLCA